MDRIKQMMQTDPSVSVLIIDTLLKILDDDENYPPQFEMSIKDQIKEQTLEIMGNYPKQQDFNDRIEEIFKM